MPRSRDDDDWDDDDRPRRKSRRARGEDDDYRPRSTQKKKRKSGGLSPMVWIGAGVGALVLIVVSIGLVVAVVLIPSEPMITVENIQKIKTGMSQKDVEKIFGAPGKVVSKSQMGGIEAKSVLWEDSKGGHVQWSFMDDKAVAGY
jgi:hypothetical protein